MRSKRTRSGDGVAILSRVAQEDLSEEVTCERKPENMRENRAALWRRALKAGERASAKARRRACAWPVRREARRLRGGYPGTSRVTRNLASSQRGCRDSFFPDSPMPLLCQEPFSPGLLRKLSHRTGTARLLTPSHTHKYDLFTIHPNCLSLASEEVFPFLFKVHLKSIFALGPHTHLP